MPELTAQQEAFAAAYVETGNGSKAYRLSYDVGADTKPETVWSNASRLLADSKVKARVKDLQAEARELLMVSVGTLTDELESARAKAMAEPKGASAAVSATLGKAKLHGLLIEKAELTGKDGKDLMPADHSPRKLAKAVALILAKGMKEGNG
ncbi:MULTISPECIES: terminase small subunit [unclassified Mesorhizobium]|uniref:terminase small subunit n=1 Tax=unclassified Mesorhizobium TaxID=325217 RepID=UPI0003CFE48E|nr:MULTISPECIES: terminase small subunit [unclassified Mesorhizobium]ESZ06477.1 terminase [Mesorhizobium sp. L2C089B000]WJI52561.1 terminase small subunit [Mesorhizobium sp. C089B]